MKNATWRALGIERCAALALGVLFVVGACASTTTEGSESHFVTCKVDADCVDAGFSACVAGTCTKEASGAGRVDASGAQRDATADASVRNADGGLPDVSDCKVDSDFRHVANLTSFCAAFDRGGYAYPCPKNRDELLKEIPAQCGPIQTPGTLIYPRFSRSCGIDVVFLDPNSPAGEFHFDSATGVLVGGVFQLGSGSGTLHCDDYAGQWLVGEQPSTECSSIGAACDLCVTGDPGCPAEIAAALPAPACAPVADAGVCSCGPADSILPYNGTPCGGSGACASCAANGCTSECVCMRDGVVRVRQHCP